MPLYEYRCQTCRDVFGVERSMTDETKANCEACGSEDVSRIWNAFIRTGGITPDVGQGTSLGGSTGSSYGSKSGCGSCVSRACGTCH